MGHFYVHQPYGWLAILALILPLVMLLGITDIATFLRMFWVAFGAVLVGLVGLGVCFFWRDWLWLRELRLQVLEPDLRFRPQSLWLWASLGFLIVIIEGGILFVVLAVLLFQRQGALPITEAGIWVVSGLSIITVWAAGIYSLFRYGQWRQQILPDPIFMDEDALYQVVKQALDWRIQSKARGRTDLQVEAVSVKRNAQAGLTVVSRVEMETSRVEGDTYLQMVQYIRAVSTAWGRLTDIHLDRPVAYVPDPSRPYTPPPVEVPIEGDLLFVGRSKPATVEEAIIAAITNNEGDADSNEKVQY